MKKLKRVMIMALTAGMLTGMFSASAYAADSKITGISIVVESDLDVGDEYQSDDVVITTKNDHYFVGNMEFVNEGYEWTETDIPLLEVYIEAADGYYLSLSTKNIKIKGATYRTAQRIDSKTVLLTLALPSLRETVGEVTDVRWSSKTEGSWVSAYNAGIYEVKLYRDSKLVRSTQKTSTNHFDFIAMMMKEGSYIYKVRAVNSIKSENKSEWVESGETYIDAATAAQIRATYGNSNPNATEPGQLIPATITYGWNQDAVGWWYRNTDGSYATNNWQYINDKWYYFNSQGYMQTGWILWKHLYYYCDDVSGAMLVNTRTPDGCRLDSAGVWIR